MHEVASQTCMHASCFIIPFFFFSFWPFQSEWVRWVCGSGGDMLAGAGTTMYECTYVCMYLCMYV